MKIDGIKAEYFRVIEHTFLKTGFCSSMVAVKYLQIGLVDDE